MPDPHPGDGATADDRAVSATATAAATGAVEVADVAFRFEDRAVREPAVHHVKPAAGGFEAREARQGVSRSRTSGETSHQYARWSHQKA